MANQPETQSYDAGVYQLATTDPVQGGVGGIANAPLLNLANRTAYLKQHVDNIENGTTVPTGLAVKNSPIFTGNPTAPTPALGDSSLSISTTAFVQGTINGVLTKSVAGGVNVTLSAIEAGSGIFIFTGAITAPIAVIVPTSGKQMMVVNRTTGGYTLTIKTAAGTGIVVAQNKQQELVCDGTNVILASSDFTGIAIDATSTVPTAAVDTNSGQIASTSFVLGQASGVTPLMDGTAAVGTTTRFARADHVHPIDTSRAPLASPVFTGAPAGTTAAQFDNSTLLASTAFVQRALGNMRTVISISGNTTLVAADVGKFYWINGSAAYYVNLPQLNTGVPDGSILEFASTCSVPITIYRTGADNIYAAATPLQSIQLFQGDNVSFVAYAGNWIAYNGTAVHKFSALYAASLGSNSGYQKLPSGMIMQWGFGTMSATGVTNTSVGVTYPMAFPNNCWMVTGSFYDSFASTGGGSWGVRPVGVTTSGFTAVGDNNGANYNFDGKAVGFSWFAIGR